MCDRPWYQITMIRMMSCVSLVGCVFGLIIHEWEQLDLIMEILISLFVFAGPSLLAVHLAIEGNRREDSQRQTNEGGSSRFRMRNGRPGATAS